MIVEPYNFTTEDFEQNQNNLEANIHDYEEGGFCKLETGDKIKKYKLDKLLGEGSYSTVWRVSNENKIYAIKISKSNKSDEEVGLNEVNILKKLKNQDYILHLEDSFMFKKNNEKHLCMVVENLGLDLHILKRLFRYTDYDSEESSDTNVNSIMRCVPLVLAKKITYQILKGLDVIHSKNIIHTDIKLDNILITGDIESIKYNKDINIKICDFGTSHNTTDKSNFNVGTIDYSAPECIIGLPYGTGIDVWATGCILFEILTGVCLFDYTRYYLDVDDDESSGYSSSSYDNENDKTQIEFLILCMMKSILGEFPGKVFKKGKYYENYFDYKGRLRFIPLFLEEDSILDTLVEDFNFDEEVSENINHFILKMLTIDPDKRSNVKTLLEDSWFNDKCD
jgi:serine/threonine protein kinase